MNAQAGAMLQAGSNALRAGRLDEAVRTLQQAASADPNHYDTFAYLGAAYAQQQNYEGSRRAFGRAVQLQPDSARARFNLGKAHEMAGDQKAARICYRAALRIDEGYTQAKEALDKLPPEVVNMWELSAPGGGGIHLAGAQAATYEDQAPVTEASHMTAEEIAQLSMPKGHLHLTGAQAIDDTDTI